LVLQSPERGLNVPIIATGEEAETVVWGMSHVGLFDVGVHLQRDGCALFGQQGVDWELNRWLESSKWIIFDILAILTP
jgi:hypothetical protein